MLIRVRFQCLGPGFFELISPTKQYLAQIIDKNNIMILPHHDIFVLPSIFLVPSETNHSCWNTMDLLNSALCRKVLSLKDIDPQCKNPHRISF